jgi:NAD(P)-dependent dehydrogenase (short-subunit alcohol dehydrogenase family)
VADEIAEPGAPVEVAWRTGARRTPVLQWSGDRPVTDEPVLGLTAESVVLLTGGARGITAGVAIAMARQSGCRVELVGRSPLPEGAEDADLAACADLPALRSAFIARGLRKPREIEKECDRVMAAREVRATLAALDAAGATVRYHPVDVRDEAALRAVIDDVYDRYGRLDGVVHGAGMLDDHFITEKTPEAFARVFATKVDAARTLLRALREDLRFIVFFGSIAGVVGNRGQADYAAANDALDATAFAQADRAVRVLSVDWGPWEPSIGMVSPELAKRFVDSGVGLIEQDDGMRRLLAEIVEGAAHQVVVARCRPEVLAPPASGGTTGDEPLVREVVG